MMRISSGEHRKYDTALRHKIRNLRAKVRLLLPLELCCKEQRRSKNLIKMQHNRHMQLTAQPHRWNCQRETLQELYVPDKPLTEKHLFQKLTPAELQQIKEDKLYYVGQEFLEHFDQFLEARQKSHSPGAPPKMKKQYSQLQSIPQLNNKSSLSAAEFAPREKENALQARVKQELRMESIQAKRKLITEEDITRRTYIKIRGRQQMERHLLNHNKMNVQKEEAIRQRNQVDMLRTAHSFQKKQNWQERGQICQLSEQLRSLCLMRHSKSAKLVSRG